jgi:hypothetical protein
MQRSIDYRALWKQAQKWDARLGKWFGNADHMRRDGDTPLNYALRLVGRIFLVGFVVSLTAFVVCWLVAIQAPSAIIFAGSIAFGLVLLTAGFYLYPSVVFAMPFVVTIGLFSIVEMAYQATGGFEVASVVVVAQTLFAWALPFLIALAGIDAIGRIITRAFERFYRRDAIRAQLGLPE